MKSFLFLLIVLTCLGAYFEYSTEQQHAAAYLQQLSGLQAQQTKLADENQKLEAANAQLTQDLGIAQGRASGVAPATTNSSPAH
jgi:cell division protein FtsB